MPDDTRTLGLQGHQYQAGVVMLFFNRGVYRKWENFVIETEVDAAEKFDDVVFDEGNHNYTLLQLKHKESDGEIDESELFNNLKGKFSLIKYVCSHKQIKESDRFKGKTIKNFCIFTNNKLSLKTLDNSKKLHSKAGVKWYLKTGPVESTKDTSLDDIIFEVDNQGCEYHTFNNQTVVNLLLKQSNDIYNIMTKEENKRLEKEENKGKPENAEKHKIRTLLENLTKEDIDDALKNIIYAVNQPDQETLYQIVKQEMTEYFKFRSVDFVFNELNNLILNWLGTKKIYFPTQRNPCEITYNDAKNYLDQYIKPIYFNVLPPVQSFCGRKKELELIHEKLQENKQVLISGLGGIGKTQLTRMFIQEYKASEYFSRIVWIVAENEKTFENCFKELCKKIGIQLLKLDDKSEILKSQFGRNINDKQLIYVEKSIEEIIEEVVQYFQDVKLLFVFDNLDTLRDDNAKKYFEHFRNELQKISVEFDILITSRNRKYVNQHVGLLDLNVLDKNDSIELIKDQLKSRQEVSDADAVAFSKIIQYFPLALQQAISYIIQTDDRKKLSRSKYTIKNYIEDFGVIKELKPLLDFIPDKNYCDGFSETTSVIWQITLNGMRNEKNGDTALSIIYTIAYFHSENIKASLFVELFHQNEEKIFNAFELLEKYSMIRQTSNGYFQIHRLVQYVIQLNLKESPVVEYSAVELAIELAMKEMIDHNLDQKLNFQSICHFIFENIHFSMKFAKYQFGYELALRFAVMNKNIKAVNELLKHELDFKNTCTCQFCKDSLLHLSALNGCKEITEVLLEKGFDIHALNGESQQPIHLAAIEGHKSIIDLFAQAGVKLNSKNLHGNTVLHLAAQNGHIDLVEHLLNLGMDACCRNKLGSIAMHSAAFGGRADIIDFFINNGFDLNTKNNYGNTVLHLAAEGGHLDLVKHLLDMGIDACCRNNDGSIAMHYAGGGAHVKIIDFFIKNGIDMNTKDNNGVTVLHCAAGYGHLNLVKHLLNMGMDPYCRNEFGLIAMHCAAFGGHADIVDFFVKNGISLNAKNYNGTTILHFAARYGHLDLVKHLLDMDMDACCKDNKGAIAMHYAAIGGHLNIIEFFVKHGIDLNTANEVGFTVLHYAACYGHLNLIKHLVDEGIDIQNNSDSVATHTVNKKLDINLKTKWDETALDLALREGYSHIVQYLLESAYKRACYENSNRSGFRNKFSS